ncbi:hypothetical protein PCASD_20988 [Puccinia coronata f. sp. avenae]|uniref:Zinc-finger domain-containing protein n=1 Tax=Puccinia coronata f. sp. avenae TaxID=200324 RepID=A0A2N5TR27_9BASI|nr:hypothetical protein PCASD_20988 [Puccinia coronata f. sp. avenae]
MPNSRRQSAAETQPSSSSNPQTAASHQPTLTAARLESSIIRKFHSLVTHTSATNASTPPRNSISRAAVSSQPKISPTHNVNQLIGNGLSACPEATTSSQNKTQSSTLPKKQHKNTAGLGLPSSNSGSVPTKRNLTTSDLPSSTNHKKNKPAVEVESKNEKNTSISADLLRCHQCRAEVPIENAIMCSNEDIARSNNRRRRSEPNQNSSTHIISSNLNAKTPSSQLGPCRVSFCGRCLLGRYGEDLKKLRPEVKIPYKWDCPVCQDYCNCSICRKKKGLPPTGKLAKAAIEAGCTSVRELLAVNPNAQGPEILNQEANRRGKDKEQPPSAPSLPKAKSDASNKKLLKLKNSESSTPKSKKPINQLVTKKSDYKKKMTSQDPKHLEAVKKLKKQHQVEKSKAEKSGQSSSKQAPLPSKQPATSVVNGNKTSEQSTVEVHKAPARRAPHVVQAPTLYSCFPTGILGSGQILKRLHVREFVCRFKNLIPGLGGTEMKNSQTETHRAQKIIDSMDDIVNFWIDDEGGMRAIMNGLTRLIESDSTHADQSTERSSPLLKSTESAAILAQLKRESKSATTPAPYQQHSVPCWLTAINLLKEEGLESLFEKDIENPYISSFDGSASMEHSNDERLQRLKFSPVKKLAIISELIDIALRGQTLSEDLIQGVEREKQAKADILKERVKLNKQWSETKAKKLSLMPSKKSLLVTSDSGQLEKPSKALLERETARVQALVEWEADMSQAELAHKNEIRMSSVEQYKAESSNRLRFQSLGKDPRNNSYYILSSTPGRLYPSDPIELAYAWSYNLIIHGSEPTNSNIKGKKKSNAQKKEQGDAAPTPHDFVMATKNDDKQDAQIDMLEGGQRPANDQWIRISDPKEIRQLASWIEYEAKLVDFKNSTSRPSSSGTNSKKTPNSTFQQTTTTQAQIRTDVNDSAHPLDGGSNDHCFKSMQNLVDQINRFSEFLELKINERVQLDQHDRRGLKSRNNS